MQASKLIIEVIEIRGKWPVHQMGDKIVMQGSRIILEQTDSLYIHARASLLHYAVPLREGVNPEKLGLSSDGGDAYIQCLDSGEPYTKGGTVIFRYRKE